MTFESKKEHILRCVKLGMDLLQAELVAECSLSEIDQLDEDKKFLRQIKFHYAISEFQLLEKHDRAMHNQLTEGKTGAAQWKLERMNPKRWGKDDKKQLPEFPNLNVNLTGVYPKTNER